MTTGHGAAVEPLGLLSKRVRLPGEVALPHAAGTALPSRVFSGHQVPCDSEVHVRSAGPLGTCGGRGQNRPKYGPSLLYKSKARLNSQLYVKFTHFRLRFPRSLLHYSHLTEISFGYRPQAG